MTQRSVTALRIGNFKAFADIEPHRVFRRLHRLNVEAIVDGHLLPAFGAKVLSAITKADVPAFRASLVKLPGRCRETLSPATINKVFGIPRQCMTDATDRY